MYSREQASTISGVKSIVDSSDLPGFLKAVKERGTFSSRAGAISMAWDASEHGG